jgi:hypothetical protein
MYQRFLKDNIIKASKDTPVITVCGARQSGKSTLLTHMGEDIPNLIYKTFDEVTTRSIAQQNPQAFLEGLARPLVLDEVQHVPALFQAIKYFVDKDRKPGEFYLTGSANILTLPKISESLAGRMELQTLWPLSHGEIISKKEDFIDRLFSPSFSLENRTLDDSIENILLKGGYPEVIKRDSERRHQWFQSYLDTILQRDIAALSKIEGVTFLPDLLTLLAERVGGLNNMSDLSRGLGLPHTTLVRYLSLLKAIFLTVEVQPWFTNVSQRVVKSNKIFFNDSGLLGFLLGATDESLKTDRKMFGKLLENFVFMELMKQIGWNRNHVKIYYFRTRLNQEVDFVLENFDGRIVGVEVKSSTSYSENDSKGLKILKEYAGKHFYRGTILYTGIDSLQFEKDMYLLPISSLWD